MKCHECPLSFLNGGRRLEGLSGIRQNEVPRRTSVQIWFLSSGGSRRSDDFLFNSNLGE